MHPEAEASNNEDDPELLHIESIASNDSGNPHEDRELTEEEMASQLNPDAKEFVPLSPQRTSPASSPFNRLYPNLNIDDDFVLAQSPRKGSTTTMDNIEIPSENDFDLEIQNCPKELTGSQDTSPTSSGVVLELRNGERPGSSSSNCSYQEMNLKEAMHGDEKQEYAPEDGSVVTPEIGAANSEDLSSTEPLSDAASGDHNLADESMAKFLRESADPMSMSFYNDGTAQSSNPFTVDLNSVQMLPVDDDEEEVAEVKPKDFNSIVQDPFYLEGNEGQHFVIQDTEFGMNNGTGTPQSDDRMTPQIQLQQDDEISKPEEDQYSPVTETKDIEESFQQNVDVQHAEESDKPESDLLANEPSSIVQVVQEMASEVTSLLNDVTIHEEAISPLPETETETASITSPQFEAENFVEDIKNDNLEADKYVDTGLSPVANIYNDISVARFDTSDFEEELSTNDLAEPEQSKPDSYVEPSALEAVTAVDVVPVQITPLELKPETPAVEEPVVAVTEEEPTPEPTHVTNSDFANIVGGDIQVPIDLISAADETSPIAPEVIVAGTVAAVALTAATGRLLTTGSAAAVPKKAAASPASKTKKPEAAKPTKAASTAAPAPIRRPTSSSVTATTASATTAKPKVASLSAKPAPTPRPRAVPSTTTASKPAIEKKTTTSITAAKKPLTNGETKSSSTTSATSAIRKTTVSAVKSTTAARPATTVASSTKAPIRSTLCAKPGSAAAAPKPSTASTVKPPTTTR